MKTATRRTRWRPGLAGQVLIGLVLGPATGVFFGELQQSRPRRPAERSDHQHRVPRRVLRGAGGAVRRDAVLGGRGSAWTLVFPQFGVVVPRPNVVTGPIAFAIPRNAPELHDYVSTWVALKRRDGVSPHLYDFWILGRGAQSTAPSWSIIRDALGWID